MSVIHITKENFEEKVLNASGKVLLDFWAPWCGPCQMIGPVVEQIAEERADITVGKINVDDEMELAKQYRIMSIPTLLVFKGGKLVGQSMGYQSLESLQKLMEV